MTGALSMLVSGRMIEMRKGSLVLAAMLAATACGPDRPASDASGARIVYPADLDSLYTASGPMGDAEAGSLYVSVDRTYRDPRRQGDHDGQVTRVAYSAGPRGWAGLHWLWPEGNLGESPGRSLAAERVSFDARGETGQELVEFRVGGAAGDAELPYRDSVTRSTGGMLLERDWKRYVIDLSGEDLSSVISGFAWTIQARANTDPVVFYFDNVRFE